MSYILLMGAVRQARGFLIGLLATTTVLTMIATDRFLNLFSVAHGNNVNNRARVTVRPSLSTALMVDVSNVAVCCAEPCRSAPVTRGSRQRPAAAASLMSAASLLFWRLLSHDRSCMSVGLIMDTGPGPSG